MACNASIADSSVIVEDTGWIYGGNRYGTSQYVGGAKLFCNGLECYALPISVNKLPKRFGQTASGSEEVGCVDAGCDDPAKSVLSNTILLLGISSIDREVRR